MRKTKLTETSFIITWYTKSYGKIKTVAKGARRAKSPFSGLLDLFFDTEIQFVRSKKSELHILKEVVLGNPHEGLRKVYQRLQVASYFVELIELVTEPEHPTPELYDLLKRAFGYLNSNLPTKRALLHFESELARLLGVHKQSGSPALMLGHIYGRLPLERLNLMKSLK